MRKTCASIIVVLTIGLLLFVSCEKEEIVETESDYRTKWAGIYKCQKECNIEDSASTVYLEVTLANGDSLLNIDEKRDSVNPWTTFKYLNYTVKINAYGDMKWYSRGNDIHAVFYATFYGDSIYAYNSAGYALGSGTSQIFIYKGLKLKE